LYFTSFSLTCLACRDKACGPATQTFEQNIDSAIEAAAHDARESSPEPDFC
jgi:hypothetical protein